MGRRWTRLQLNFLLSKFFSRQCGPITRLSHREINFHGRKYHRVFAAGTSDRISGVGLDEDLFLAQMKAVMECLERETYFQRPGKKTTSGMGAHFSKNYAEQVALLELIERDQVLLSVFFNRTLLELPSFSPLVRFYYLTRDLPIHVVMAEIKTEEGGKCYGFGCAIEIRSAKEKALGEALVLFDSREAEIVGDPTGNLHHILPFLHPHMPTKLERFSSGLYAIERIQESSLEPLSHGQLRRTLEQKNISISFEHSSRPLGFGFGVTICRGMSNDLQELFFSDTKVILNPKRSAMMGQGDGPSHFILHPIS